MGADGVWRIWAGSGLLLFQLVFQLFDFPEVGGVGGERFRAAAVLRGQMDTRHYAKRQFTFARHQLSEFQWLPTAAVPDLEG